MTEVGQWMTLGLLFVKAMDFTSLVVQSSVPTVLSLIWVRL